MNETLDYANHLEQVFKTTKNVMIRAKKIKKLVHSRMQTTKNPKTTKTQVTIMKQMMLNKTTQAMTKNNN